MSWQLYIGKKYKHLSLSNQAILEATLKYTINEPLSLKLSFNLSRLLKQKSDALVANLIDYNTEFYLENKNLNIGYLMIKKHNQSQKTIILQKGETSYTVPTGLENLDSGFNFSSEIFQTNLSGNINNGKVVSNSKINNNRYELVIMDKASSSQNLVNQINQEEVSVTSQILSGDILTLTLFSGLAGANNVKNGLIYGQEYNTDVNTLISNMLPGFQIISNTNKTVKYTLEPKQNLEIVNDILTSVILRDGGYDLMTGVQKIEILDPKTTQVSHRLLNNNTFNRGSPVILNIKENYPTLSGEILSGDTFIREGDKVKIDFHTEANIYRSDLIYGGSEIDLLYNYNPKSQTVFLLKNGREVRRNYLEQNLKSLSNRII